MKRFSFLLPLCLICSCAFSPANKEDRTVKDKQLMELPKCSSKDVLLQYDGYVCKYNSTYMIPDWVAYELTASETNGDWERDGCTFRADASLKERQPDNSDYSGSGWTRGHMAPAGDFKWSSHAINDTFYYINCCPQDATLNAKDWNYLEQQVRKWAKEYGKVWVVSGPIVGDDVHGKIGDGVVVPDAFFKAVLVENNGFYRSIAFIMKNNSSRQYLDKCALTVNELEALTKIDFFPQLDDRYEESVEAQKHFTDWHIRTR